MAIKMKKKVYCIHHITDCPYYKFDSSCDFVDAFRGRWAVQPRKCFNMEKDDNDVERSLVTEDSELAALTGIIKILKRQNVMQEYYCSHCDWTCPYYMNMRCNFEKHHAAGHANEKPLCEHPGLGMTQNPQDAILYGLARVMNELKKIKEER